MKLPRETSLDVIAICSALQKEATEKVIFLIYQILHHIYFHILFFVQSYWFIKCLTRFQVIEERRYPLEALDRFLVAAIRWLRRVGEEEKPEIIQDVIKESLKVYL